eukprot:4363301-Pyramimonas_sp.AAC.1
MFIGIVAPAETAEKAGRKRPREAKQTDTGATGEAFWVIPNTADRCIASIEWCPARLISRLAITGTR